MEAAEEIPKRLESVRTTVSQIASSYEVVNLIFLLYKMRSLVISLLVLDCDCENHWKFVIQLFSIFITEYHHELGPT